NVLKSAAIAYGRRQADAGLSLDDLKKQGETFVTYTQSAVTNAIDAAHDYRTPLPAETRTYQLTGYSSTGAAGRFQASDLVKPDPADPDPTNPKTFVPVFDSELLHEQQPG